MKRTQIKEDNSINEDGHNNEDNHKNEDNTKNEENLKYDRLRPPLKINTRKKSIFITLNFTN